MATKLAHPLRPLRSRAPGESEPAAR